MMTPFILILFLVACAATASRAGTASDTSFPKIISCSLQRPIITINNDEEIEGGGFVQSQQQQSDINISEGSTSTTQETTPNAVSSNGMIPWGAPGFVPSGGGKRRRAHRRRRLTWLPGVGQTAADTSSSGNIEIQSASEEVEQSSVVASVDDSSLSNGGYTVSIGDVILIERDEKDAAIENHTLVAGKEYSIGLSPTRTIGRPVLAFLFRLDPGTAPVNTTGALQPSPLTSQVVDSCLNDLGVGGLSQINHYSANGPVAMDDPGQVGRVKLDGSIADATVNALVLTVTVVDDEYRYYSSSYNLRFKSPSTPTVDFLPISPADIAAPTAAPTANAVEMISKTIPDDESSSSADSSTVSSTASSDDNDGTANVRTIWIATACSLLVAVGIMIVILFFFTNKYKKRIAEDNNKSAIVAAASASGIVVGHELV